MTAELGALSARLQPQLEEGRNSRQRLERRVQEAEVQAERGMSQLQHELGEKFRTFLEKTNEGLASAMRRTEELRLRSDSVSEAAAAEAAATSARVAASVAECVAAAAAPSERAAAELRSEMHMLAAELHSGAQENAMRLENALEVINAQSKDSPRSISVATAATAASAERLEEVRVVRHSVQDLHERVGKLERRGHGGGAAGRTTEEQIEARMQDFAEEVRLLRCQQRSVEACVARLKDSMQWLSSEVDTARETLAGQSSGVEAVRSSIAGLEPAFEALQVAAVRQLDLEQRHMELEERQAGLEELVEEVEQLRYRVDALMPGAGETSSGDDLGTAGGAGGGGGSTAGGGGSTVGGGSTAGDVEPPYRMLAKNSRLRGNH
eukprot:NODE_9679_length_1406_cov_6.419859.p1 GENE.NODE_9679_length_1406_cov_6.419859~~NODE_9679_length_1406_cov_6.419859.p1  ORF type:complete len:394 (-),score=183.08 NODE_9679_length_1406_cov_6.419859:224-1366(-)